ncbi:MAG: winged helix-turn-helix domain-containing protein [Candidatus Bathyarchaeota archaeon]|nr:winged helix-turn-helix domain-containing protein [Candidatus Bathyarchaeota archaeon]
MSPRRSSFQIAVDVLSVMHEGESRPTRIMYASNLSWNTLKSTLDLLVNKGYTQESIGVGGRQKQYFITPSGLNVLRYYDRLEELVKIDVTT